MPSVQKAMCYKVNEPLEHDGDRKAKTRLRKLEPYMRPDIQVLVSYSGDFEEINSGDLKIEPVHYQYQHLIKQIRQTVRPLPITLFDLRFQVHKITPKYYSRYLYLNPDPVTVYEKNEFKENSQNILIYDVDLSGMQDWRPNELPEDILVMPQPHEPVISQTPPRNRCPYLQDNQLHKLENKDKQNQLEVPSQPRPEIQVMRRKTV